VFDDDASLKRLLDKDIRLPVVPGYVSTAALPAILQQRLDRIYPDGEEPRLDVLRVVYYYSQRLPTSPNTQQHVAEKCAPCV